MVIKLYDENGCDEKERNNARKTNEVNDPGAS